MDTVGASILFHYLEVVPSLEVLPFAMIINVNHISYEVITDQG